jgi:hypothetical protein
MTRGGETQQEVARDGRERRAAVLQRSRGRAECQRRKKRGGGLKDLIGICKNLRDFTINSIFPTDPKL